MGLYASNVNNFSIRDSRVRGTEGWIVEKRGKLSSSVVEKNCNESSEGCGCWQKRISNFFSLPPTTVGFANSRAASKVKGDFSSTLWSSPYLPFKTRFDVTTVQSRKKQRALTLHSVTYGKREKVLVRHFAKFRNLLRFEVFYLFLIEILNSSFPSPSPRLWKLTKNYDEERKLSQKKFVFHLFSSRVGEQKRMKNENLFHN